MEPGGSNPVVLDLGAAQALVLSKYEDRFGSQPVKLRTSRRFPLRPRRLTSLAALVDRAVRAHQQGDQILDLLDGEHLVGAEPRHQRAGECGLRVVDLLIRRLGFALPEVAQLAVLSEARTDRAVAQLAPRDLMAGVAIAAVRPRRRIVGEAHPVSGLRQRFALLPVTQEFSVRRI